MKALDVYPPTSSLRFATDVCCNCGTSTAVDAVEVPLILTRFFGGGGAEYRLTGPDRGPVLVGHCSTCSPTAKRLRPGFAGRVVTWAALSVLLGIAVAIALGTLSSWDAIDHAVWAGPSVALVTLGAWIATRRAPGNARSYYQAVWVVRLHQRFSGEVVSWRLGFANDEFAKRFVEDNPAAKAVG